MNSVAADNNNSINSNLASNNASHPGERGTLSDYWDAGIFDHLSSLLAPPGNDVTPEPSAMDEQVRQYIMWGMFGLICHITLVNLCAVMTLTYGIIRHSTSWAIRLICERRRLRTLSPKPLPKCTSSPGRFDSRRGAVVSQRIGASNMANPPIRVDCSTYPYLLSLALSDLFIGIAIAPLQLDLFRNHGHWHHGYCTSSAMHTAAIAVDRWWSITCESAVTMQPALKNSAQPKVRLQRTLLTFLWILSAMVSVPVMYLWQIESPERLSTTTTNDLTCEPVADNTYLLLSAMVSFFLPLTLTIAFYVQIAILIRNRWTLLKRRTVIEFSSILTSMMLLGTGGGRRHEPTAAQPALIRKPGFRMHASATTLPTIGPSNGFLETTAPSISKAVTSISLAPNNNGHSSLIHDDTRISNIARTMTYLKHIRNLIRAMSFVVLMYVFCWLPLYSTLLVKALCRCIDTHDWERLVGIFTWLGYANSGLNPIIYFVTLEEYRVLSISLFRLIGERIAMLPKIIFRLCWWLYDKRVRTTVRLRDFIRTGDPSESFAQRTSVLKTKAPTKSRAPAAKPRQSLTLIKPLSMSPEPVASAPSLDSESIQVVNEVCNKLNNDAASSEITITDPVATSTAEEQAVPLLPLYYDPWGRPINYDAIESTI